MKRIDDRIDLEICVFCNRDAEDWEGDGNGFCPWHHWLYYGCWFHRFFRWLKQRRTAYPILWRIPKEWKVRQ